MGSLDSLRRRSRSGGSRLAGWMGSGGQAATGALAYQVALGGFEPADVQRGALPATVVADLVDVDQPVAVDLRDREEVVARERVVLLLGSRAAPIVELGAHDAEGVLGSELPGEAEPLREVGIHRPLGRLVRRCRPLLQSIDPGCGEAVDLRGRGGVALLDADGHPSALLEGAPSPIARGHARAAAEPAPLAAQPLADVVAARGRARQQAEERVVQHRVLRAEGSVLGKGSRLASQGYAPARL